MKKLTKDTMFYRADHPDGCMFAKGGPAPDPRDGWVATPDEIEPLPETVFECTTLVAFQELLNSERASFAKTRADFEAQIADLTRRLATQQAQTPDAEA